MYVAPLCEIDNVPSLSAMLGSTTGQDIIDEINMHYGGDSAVSFGQVSNPMNTCYSNFMNLITTQIAPTNNLITQTMQSVLYPETWRTIDTEEALALPPQSMQVALLMTPSVLELFKNHQISGWGWNPDTFPDTDMYERTLSNGSVETRPDPKDVPDEVVWTWSTDTTDYDIDNDEDYDALTASRRYIEKFVEQELGPDGQRRDPTDTSQTMSI